jgi:hypothetical protein
MTNYYIFAETETAERVGAGGLFAVTEIRDWDENDVTTSFDLGNGFFDQDSLQAHIARQLNLATDDIDLVIEYEL